MSAPAKQIIGVFCLLLLGPALLPSCALPADENSNSYSLSQGGDAPAEEEDESSDLFLKFFTPAATSVAPWRRRTTAASTDGFKPGICLEIPTPPPLRA